MYNKNEKIWREYEIVDIDTGEILKNISRKDYKTINIEKTINTNKYGQKIEKTTRIVEHNGQQRIEF